MNNGLPQGLDAIHSPKSASANKISDIIAARNRDMVRLIRGVDQARGNVISATSEQEKQFRTVLIEKQQQLIDTQRALLAEARKDKWLSALIVGVVCAIIPLLLQWIF